MHDPSTHTKQSRRIPKFSPACPALWNIQSSYRQMDGPRGPGCVLLFLMSAIKKVLAGPFRRTGRSCLHCRPLQKKKKADHFLPFICLRFQYSSITGVDSFSQRESTHFRSAILLLIFFPGDQPLLRQHSKHTEGMKKAPVRRQELFWCGRRDLNPHGATTTRTWI